MWSAVKVDGTAALCTGSLYPASRSRATGWQFGDSFYMYGGVDATLYYYDLWKLEVSVTLASCPPGSEPVGEVCMMCTDYKYSQTGSACIVCPDGTAAPTSTNSSSWYARPSALVSRNFICDSRNPYSILSFWNSNSCSSTQYRNSSMSVCGSCPAGFQPDPTRSFWFAFMIVRH